MKHSVFLLVVIIILVSFTGCGKQEEPVFESIDEVSAEFVVNDDPFEKEMEQDEADIFTENNILNVSGEDTISEIIESSEIKEPVATFTLELGEACFEIESNSFTPFTESSSGEAFFYEFADNRELTVYLKDKREMTPISEMKILYADENFLRENNIKIFSQEELEDGMLYVLSYSEAEEPDVIEIWKEADNGLLYLYYVTYEGHVDDEIIEIIKNFSSYIKDVTPKG